MDKPRPLGGLDDHMPRPEQLERCPTGKTGFRLRVDAELNLEFMRKKARRLGDAGRRWPVRAYECPRCRMWHLTSLAKERA